MKLLVKHPYYCNEYNYESGNNVEYETFKEFYDDWHDADVDMNLIFRFDVLEYLDNYEDNEDQLTGYYANVFIIKQRKGLFLPITIKRIEAKDEDLLMSILERHWMKLKEIWTPISTGTLK